MRIKNIFVFVNLLEQGWKTYGPHADQAYKMILRGV